MEYIEAFYPLILILIMYISIKLHDHNFRPVALLWKPFHQCFAYFRRSWDSEASVVNAFAPLLLLSFSKRLFVSFTLLHGIRIKFVNRNGTLSSFPPVMYYDSTVGYLSEDHIPLMVLTVCVALVFIVFPTVWLLLYPTRNASLAVNLGDGVQYALSCKCFRDKTKDGISGTRHI